MATKVYGASDDLIEFEGDVCGEVGCYGADDEEAQLVAFDDGTVVKVWYGGGGIWCIRALNKGSKFDRIDQCTDADADPHSDVLHLHDGCKNAWTGGKASVVQ